MKNRSSKVLAAGLVCCAAVVSIRTQVQASNDHHFADRAGVVETFGSCLSDTGAEVYVGVPSCQEDQAGGSIQFMEIGNEIGFALDAKSVWPRQTWLLAHLDEGIDISEPDGGLYLRTRLSESGPIGGEIDIELIATVSIAEDVPLVLTLKNRNDLELSVNIPVPDSLPYRETTARVRWAIPWSVPRALGYYIHAEAGEAWGESSVFSIEMVSAITPSRNIVVLRPVGGARLRMGSRQRLEWRVAEAIHPTIVLIRETENGHTQTDSRFTRGIPVGPYAYHPGPGTYVMDFDLPPDLEPADGYRIRVSARGDSALSGESGTFSIVDYPIDLQVHRVYSNSRDRLIARTVVQIPREASGETFTGVVRYRITRGLERWERTAYLTSNVVEADLRDMRPPVVLLGIDCGTDYEVAIDVDGRYAETVEDNNSLSEEVLFLENRINLDAVSLPDFIELRFRNCGRNPLRGHIHARQVGDFPISGTLRSYEWREVDLGRAFLLIEPGDRYWINMSEYWGVDFVRGTNLEIGFEGDFEHVRILPGGRAITNPMIIPVRSAE